jgi:hypothetical protein
MRGKYKKKWYDDFDWLHMMYVEKKMTMTEMGMYANISRETVRQLLIKHGIIAK